MSKWARPKPLPVGPTATLSLEQQQILAAVPRYKKAWVRPSSLKPGQNPKFKILKWVIDTDLDRSEGTEEEMREALEQVTAGNVPLPSEQAQMMAAAAAGGAATAPAPPAAGDPPSTASASAGPSNLPSGAAPTPATGSPAPAGPSGSTTAPASVPIPATELSTTTNPIPQVQGTDPAKPAEGPAPNGEAPSVQEAVKGLGEVDMAAGVDAGPPVPADAKSLVQEDQVEPQP
ncbi:hypothetical protein JCM8202_005346 [Rhodotorula sphaerocarpa]